MLRISYLLIKSIQGPEPNYQKVDSNTYNTFRYKNRFEMSHGGILPELNIAYETWGSLNERKDNAVLIFTGLSANSHAKSHEVYYFYYLFNHYIKTKFCYFEEKQSAWMVGGFYRK
jgi:hypothetical protein